MSNISVIVKASPFPIGGGVYAERRCRCGMCFDTEGRAVSVTADQLERLKADPMLVVTIVDAGTEAPQAETPTAPEPEAAKADAPASETDKTAAKADKKAG